MDKNSIVRLIVILLTWVNAWLASKGYEKIPHIDDATISMIIAGAASVWGFVKHNFIGKKGAEQKAVLKDNGLHK